MRKRGFTLIELMIFLAIVGILASILLAALGGEGDSNERAISAAKTFGFSEVEILSKGAALMSPVCGGDDTFRYTARAKNPAGQPVEITICCGVTKGCTVRTR